MRYQFEPRANLASVDLDKAKQCATDKGATGVRESYPEMYKLDERGYPTRAWRGTNQPKTVKFSAPSDAVASIIKDSYGSELVQVWNIEGRHYV